VSGDAAFAKLAGIPGAADSYPEFAPVTARGERVLVRLMNEGS